MTTKGISRREFVKSGGALVVSFSLFSTPAWLKASQSEQEVTGFKPLGPEEVDSWLAISQDGQVTVYDGLADLGPQRAAVSNAGRAAESHEMESKGLEFSDLFPRPVPDAYLGEQVVLMGR